MKKTSELTFSLKRSKNFNKTESKKGEEILVRNTKYYIEIYIYIYIYISFILLRSSKTKVYNQTKYIII